MKNKIIYLAIPYTWNPTKAFDIANRVAADLMEEGYIIFSPISHSHPIADWMEDSKRLSQEFWMHQDLPILDMCSELKLIVVGKDGMQLIEQSRGCQREKQQAINNQQPITYYYYEE